MRKPTVSMYITIILLGSKPPWAVTSRVANNLFLGVMSLSPVSALINVVLPVTKNKTRNVSIRHQYPHFFTFVTKLKFFGQTQGQGQI